jgi:hypothetical protein
MLAVTGTAQIVVLDDEQGIPLELVPHERNQRRRDVRVNVDAWLSRQPFSVRGKFRREGAHVAVLARCDC